MKPNDHTITVSVSLPIEIINIIDSKCGDIARSKYIRRVLENALKSELKSQKNAKNS